MAFVNNYKPPRNTDLILDKVCIPLPTCLESERVELTPFVPSIHGGTFFPAFEAAPELSRYLPYTSFRAFVENMRSDSNSVLFAIIDKTKLHGWDGLRGCPAGVIGFINSSKDNLAIEISPIVILPSFQRTFVTTNAIGIMLKYCPDLSSEGGLGLRRVSWSTHQDNQGSVRAAERMGMKREGHLRWTWTVPLESAGKKCGEGRGEALGRDSIWLAICWDDWENGAKERVEELIRRV